MTDAYRFGRFEVRPASRQLLVDGKPAALGARAFDVLVAVIEHRERIVTKEELLDRVWPGLVVEENNLHVQVSALRKLLGANAIATVAGRGYRFTLAPDAADASAQATAPPKHNLPAQLSSFIGRERDLAELGEMLRRERLVTLTGVGGIGKTRLALQLATSTAAEYPDGVWFADLAPLSDPRLVADAVSAAVGVALDSGLPVLELLAKHVATRRLLLILDNCEHMPLACAQVAKLVLQAGPAVTIVATSREPLHVSGEAVYAVAPLPAPDVHQPLSMQSLQDFEAVRLFVDRAGAARAGFVMTPQNAPAIGRICHALDGIPLALELAAARIRTLSADAIDAHLADRFRLLKGGDPTALPRHRTLRAAIDWSHELLAPPERVLLRRLSVFAGGFALEGAEAVGPCDEVPRDDVLDLLGQLVDKSLVTLDVGNDRYRLLETVRQYALERLAEAGDEAGARDAHLRFYVTLAQRAGPELSGPREVQWRARLDEERENILQAHAHCRAAEAGGEAAFVLLYTLRPWLARDHLEQWHRICREALADPRAASPTLWRSRALYAAAFVTYLMGLYEESRAWAEESLAIAESRADQLAAGEAHCQLASALLGLRSGEALKHFEAGYAIGRALGNVELTTYGATGVGETHAQQDRHDLAQPWYAESLELSRVLDSPYHIALALYNLTRCSIVAGHRANAREQLREAIALSGDDISLQQAQAILTSSAAVATLEERYALAARLYGAAEAHRERHAIRLEPSERPFNELMIARVRSSGDRPAIDAAWAEGRALDDRAAVDEARNWLASPPPA